MNWLLVLLLSGFGILMGILSVSGMTKKMEPFFWLVFGFFTAFMISRNVSEKAFWHGLLVGIFWGVLRALVQSIFFTAYLKNNPSYREKYEKNKFFAFRYYILIVGPIVGIITGSVIGGLAWLFQKTF